MPNIRTIRIELTGDNREKMRQHFPKTLAAFDGEELAILKATPAARDRLKQFGIQFK